jgi:hypothetical protein
MLLSQAMTSKYTICFFNFDSSEYEISTELLTNHQYIIQLSYHH